MSYLDQGAPPRFVLARVVRKVLENREVLKTGTALEGREPRLVGSQMKQTPREVVVGHIGLTVVGQNGDLVLLPSGPLLHLVPCHLVVTGV